MQKEVKENGHPLFWGEWKPVSLYSTWINDFAVTDIVDMTPGSGAACLAAIYASAQYTAFCHNSTHQKWLQDLISRMFVAIVLDGSVKAEAELVKHVQTYLQRAAEAARGMLPKKTSALAFGDSFVGDNDSADEE